VPTVAQVISTTNPAIPARLAAGTVTQASGGYVWATFDNTDAEVQASNVGSVMPVVGAHVLLVMTSLGTFCLGKIGE
jgi:hypothetical protein